LKITVIGLISMSSGITTVQAQITGVPFLNRYSIEVNKFVLGYEDELKIAIANDNEFTWLNLIIPNTGGITIRQYLISELTIDYTINNTDI
jgi:hypothetical protein